MIINQKFVDAYLARFKDPEIQGRVNMFWKGVEDSRKRYGEKPTAKNLRDMQAQERNLLDHLGSLDEQRGIKNEFTGTKDDLNGTPLKNIKWEFFCQEYIKDFNGARSYDAAGYTGGPWKARKKSSDLLQKQDIQKRIQELMTTRIEELHLDQTKYLKILDAIASARSTDYFSWDDKGRLTFKASYELTRTQSEAIGKIKHKINVDGSISVELEFHKKLEALNLLGKYLGLWDRETAPVDPMEIAQKMHELQGEIDETIEGPPPMGAPEPDAQPETDEVNEPGPDLTIH